jgi:DNA end-binding protein Ku
LRARRVIDLEKFIPRGELDPVYFDRPYYLYPDGPIAVETVRVIGAAMAETGVVGRGRLTLARRERMVMVDPRGTGMALFTLRAADEVRAAQFPSAEGDLDPEMVAIAKSIIAQRIEKFDPNTYRDRYQEALRELIEAKMKGLSIKLPVVSTPPRVIDLMAALKRSLARKKHPRNGAGRIGRAGRRQCLIGGSRQCFCPYQVVTSGQRSLPTSRLPLRGVARRRECCHRRISESGVSQSIADGESRRWGMRCQLG